jgi:hypothetical protein
VLAYQHRCPRIDAVVNASAACLKSSIGGDEATLGRGTTRRSEAIMASRGRRDTSGLDVFGGAVNELDHTDRLEVAHDLPDIPCWVIWVGRPWIARRLSTDCVTTCERSLATREGSWTCQAEAGNETDPIGTAGAGRLMLASGRWGEAA